MISFQDYCPACKHAVDASPTVSQDELRLTDHELWRVLFNKAEVQAMHHAADGDHYWTLSKGTKANLRRMGFPMKVIGIPDCGVAETFYSNMPWDGDDLPEGVTIEHVRGSSILKKCAERLPFRIGRAVAEAGYDLSLSLRLWLRSRRHSSVGLVEGSRPVTVFSLFRSLLPTKGKVILYGFYLYPSTGARKHLLRRIIRSVNLCIVWSRRQGENYCRELQLPPNQFAVIPYKSYDSKYARSAPVFRGDFVFSGGDSERDYATLFRAVDGLDIPVIVSSTLASDPRGLKVPENVLLIRAQDPYFARLMAAARIVVIPLVAGRLRAAGDGSFMNAMWHGVPVICADDISAPEYIDNWVDGVVVAPGDAAALRTALVRLWQSPDKAREIGEAGRTKIESAYTHKHFRRRMIEIAFRISRLRDTVIDDTGQLEKAILRGPN